MIKAENLSFSYKKHRVISGLSFEAKPGECLILAGPNGSGKTTLINLLAGIKKPDAGRILLDGRVSLVPQGSALFEDMSVEENISFFCKIAKLPFPAELPLGLEKWRKIKVSKLSGGTAKRVSIACALVSEPDILLMDEPCSGLDITYKDEFASLIQELKKQKKTVVYASHDPSEFYTFYDSLVFLKNAGGRQYTRTELTGKEDNPEKLNAAYRGLYNNSDTE